LRYRIRPRRRASLALALALAAHAAIAAALRARFPPPRPGKIPEVVAGLCQPLGHPAAFAAACLARDRAFAAAQPARPLLLLGRTHRPASLSASQSPPVRFWFTGTVAARVHNVGNTVASTAKNFKSQN